MLTNGGAKAEARRRQRIEQGSHRRYHLPSLRKHQHACRADEPHAQPESRLAPGAIVNQHEVGRNRACDAQRGDLAGIESGLKTNGGIVAVGLDANPAQRNDVRNDEPAISTGSDFGSIRDGSPGSDNVPGGEPTNRS